MTYLNLAAAESYKELFPANSWTVIYGQKLNNVNQRRFGQPFSL